MPGHTDADVASVPCGGLRRAPPPVEWPRDNLTSGRLLRAGGPEHGRNTPRATFVANQFGRLYPP
jgi:hypothetical protein